MCVFDLGILLYLSGQRRRDCRYWATVWRGEDFFALERKAVRAEGVDVEGEKMDV